MSSIDFIRPIDYVDVGKYNHTKTRDRGIGLYCTASAVTHGGDDARYALQIFAPIKLANGQEGRDYVIATASLSPQDLVALRAEIDAAISEVEEVYPHATSPGDASHVAGSPATRSSHTKKRGPR
jgi:hypothetical protein